VIFEISMIPFETHGVEAAVKVVGRVSGPIGESIVRGQTYKEPLAGAAVLVPVATVRSSFGAISAGVFFEDEGSELQPATTTSPRASTTAPTFRTFFFLIRFPSVPSNLLDDKVTVTETKDSSLVIPLKFFLWS
jgi:hypothetical protein